MVNLVCDYRWISCREVHFLRTCFHLEQQTNILQMPQQCELQLWHHELHVRRQCNFRERKNPRRQFALVEVKARPNISLFVKLQCASRYSPYSAYFSMHGQPHDVSRLYRFFTRKAGYNAIGQSCTFLNWQINRLKAVTSTCSNSKLFCNPTRR